jgi:hypothetical protein
MSCGCASSLWGGRCCPSPSQIIGGTPIVPTSLPANINLSALSVFNYENFGAVQGNATLNAPAMSAMFAAASAANPVGGGCYFKQGNYPITVITGGYLVPPQTRLYGPATQAGVSTALNDGTQLLTINGDGTLFMCPVGPHTTGGQYFEHLAMAVGPAPATLNSTIAIDAKGGWGVRAYKCVFGNFPIAFRAQTLSAGLDQCVIVYNHGPNGDGPGGSLGGSNHVALVRLGAAECYAIGPSEFLQQPFGSSGPSGVCGISMEDGADHCIVRDLHISDFDTAITYGMNNTHTVKHNRFTNLKLDVWSSAVWMEPPAGGQIYDEAYIGCEFAGGQFSTATRPLVFIGTNGGANTTVDTMSYTACSAYDSNSDGYQLKNGNNFSLNGGMSSGNGPTGGAGVAVVGAFGKIDLNGVNMQPFFIGALRLQSQQYAMRFAAGAAYADVCTVRGCDWTGYPPFTAPNTGPLFVDTGGITAGGRLRVNLTKGYNDAGATVHATLPTAGTPATAASFGYFGPSRAIAGGVTSYVLNGTTVNLGAGGSLNVVLDAYDTFGVTGAPSGVVWKGIWG